MLDTLRRTGGLSALSNRLGLTPVQSAQVADALTPYLIAAFGRVFRRIGQHAFVTQLETLGGEEMAQAVLIPGPIQPSAGEAVLRFAFGSSENVDRVEQAFRQAVELDPTYYREAMRLLALLLAGYFAARSERPDFGVTDGTAELLDTGEGDELLDAIVPQTDG
jgi:hypothetical protein